MSKQTAVEWIQQQVKQQGITHYFSLTEILEKAKEMEMQQIMDAVNFGNAFNGWALKHEFKKYYNETYKKEEK
jgi:alkylhydroperoxidase family enzyme